MMDFEATLPNATFPEEGDSRKLEQQQQFEDFMQEKYSPEIVKVFAANPEVYQAHYALWREVEQEKVDELTGLRKGKELKRDINTWVGESFTEAGFDLEQAEPKKIIEFLKTTEDQEKLKNTSILVGDIAYLSLANKFGHEMGDKLLQQIGGTALEEMEAQRGKVVFRKLTGGDELCGVAHNSPPSEVNEVIASLQDRVRGITTEGKNKELATALWGLPPHVDFGMSSMSDAFKTVRKFLESGGTVPPGRRAKAFTDAGFAVADRRVTINKAMVRLDELCEIKRKDHGKASADKIFNKVAACLLKGGRDPSPEQLDEWSGLTPEERRPLFVEHLKRTLDKEVASDLEQFAKQFADESLQTPS